MSGRPRSSTTRSGLSRGDRCQRRCAVLGLDHVDSLAPTGWCAGSAGSPARHRRRGCGGAPSHGRPRFDRRCGLGHGRQADGEDRAARSLRLPAVIVPPIASTKPRQMARPEPGAGALPVLLPGRGRTCRRCARDRSGGMPAPSSIDLDRRRCRRSRRAAIRISDARRRVFRGIVEQVEQRLLEQHGIELQHRQVGREIDLDAVLGRAPCRRAAARCRRSRRDRSVSGLSSSAPASSRVMSSRLPMKRLSRSASSWMVAISSSRVASS